MMQTFCRQLFKLIIVPVALIWATLGYADTSSNNTFVLGVSSNMLPTAQALVKASGIPSSQIDIKSGYSARLAEKGDLDVAVFASPSFANKVIKKIGSQQRVTLGTAQLAAYCANCQGNTSLPVTLMSGQTTALVYANPKDAPIGKAAEEAIAKHEYPVKGRVKLEDPNGVMDYKNSKGNDVIFTTTAALNSINVDLNDKTKVFVFQASDYPSVDLTHEAVLTTKGANNPTAKKFMSFLSSCSANKILNQRGYVSTNKACSRA